MAARERFVPRTVSELTNELAELPWPDGEGAAQDGSADTEEPAQHFRSFSRLVAALFHFEFYDREQEVLGAWEAATTDAAAAGVIAGELARLLEDANYTKVSHEDLKEDMARESTLPLRLEVELADYEVLVIYRRGSRKSSIELRSWWGLRRRARAITVEDRVVTLTKVASEESFAERGVDPAKRDLVPGQMSLKQFQHVPRADIEMLLPSTKVRYRRVDTLRVGIPALASGILVLATKLLPTLGLIAVLIGAWLGLRDSEPRIDQAALVVLFGGLATIGGFVARQWSKLKNRRVEYLKTLSETLYFRTLATGPSVLHTLLSGAEQQEVVEVLLAYRFLIDMGGCTAAELDGRVEEWLHGSCEREIDFDVDNALRNLRQLDLVDGDERMVAVPVCDALVRLDERWDGIFVFPDDVPERQRIGVVAGDNDPLRPGDPST